MDKYYHFTSYDNLESISETGLIPQTGFRTKTIGDEKCAVFLSKGMDNVIRMYSAILWHYSQVGGDNGKKIIKEYKNKIKRYQEEISNYSFFADIYTKEIDSINDYIRTIKPLTKIKSFYDYLGDGCYLSVSDIKGVVPKYDDYDDCYYESIISPQKINVVTIKDKKTKEIIDEREKVLTYFMSYYELDDLLKDERNVLTIKNICDIYNERLAAIDGFYNYHNYELEEVPIKEYIKTL